MIDTAPSVNRRLSNDDLSTKQSDTITQLSNPSGQITALGQSQTSLQKSRGSNKKKKSYGLETQVLGRRMWFGQNSCMHYEGKSPFTALAAESTEVLVISRKEFQKIFHSTFDAMLQKCITFMSTLPAMQLWTPAKLASLSLMLVERQLSFNEVLFAQGSSAQKIFFIKSGSINLTTDATRVSVDDIRRHIKPQPNYLDEILAENHIQSKNTSSTKVNRKMAASSGMVQKPPIAKAASSRIIDL